MKYFQVPVVVNIIGLDPSSQAFYSYTDPATGVVNVNSPVCKINAVAPYQTLFALDYASSRNGWSIVEAAKPDPTSTMIPSFPTAGALALITFEFGSLDYSFIITFTNTVTGDSFDSDPQEGNILQPIK